MQNVSKDDFIELLNFAVFDKNLNNYEFRILSYIHLKSDFLVSDLKKDLKISSFNMISRFIKNLVLNKYIIRQSNHKKNLKNVSAYSYFINIDKLTLLKNDTYPMCSILKLQNDFYNYFFLKIPSKNKIDKYTNIHQINLLLEFDKYDFNYLVLLVDFVSSSEQLKIKYSRPLSFRKNIKEIISLFENEKLIILTKDY